MSGGHSRPADVGDVGAMAGADASEAVTPSSLGASMASSPSLLPHHAERPRSGGLRGRSQGCVDQCCDGHGAC